jgi:NTE family protein
LDNRSYFERLHGSVTRIARHSYYPGKEEAVEQCLEEIEHLRDCRRISEEQLAVLREVLLGEEGACLMEGAARERVHPVVAVDQGGIALVCEGVGCQAAFSAGVLSELIDPSVHAGRISIVGGTSAAAVNALLAWEGLLRGDPRRGIDQIVDFWEEFSARSPIETWMNYSGQMVHHLRAVLPLPCLGSALIPCRGQEWLHALLGRRIDIGLVHALAVADRAPALLVGRDGLAGCMGCVRGEEITLEDVVATASPPCGDDRAAWHVARLGSRGNSLIRGVAGLRPSEIWLVQVRKGRNRCRSGPDTNSTRPPARVEDSLLEQELSFIRKINAWLERGVLIDRRYRRIEVHRILIEHDLDDASTLDRSPSFTGRLMAYGRERAQEFLAKRQGLRARKEHVPLEV